MILGKRFSNFQFLISKFARIRGHQMAKAGLIMALADLIARKKNIPLAKLYGGVRKNIPSGISLGIQDKPAELIKRIEEALKEDYQRIKTKIKPGWDVKVISSIRKRFPKILLAVDANGAYTLKDTRLFQKLACFKLMMIEQPLAYDDLTDHSEFSVR